MVYFIILLATILLPAAFFTVMSARNAKRAGDSCRVEEMKPENLSKMKCDDTNVVKQNSNTFLLAAGTLGFTLILTGGTAIFGGPAAFSAVHLIIFGTLAAVSEYLLASFFNWSVFLYADGLVFRNFLGKTRAVSYKDAEIFKANRMVSVRYKNLNISISFDNINVEKLLIRCGVPRDSIKKYSQTERYKVKKVDPEELLKKPKRRSVDEDERVDEKKLKGDSGNQANNKEGDSGNQVKNDKSDSGNQANNKEGDSGNQTKNNKTKSGK